MRHQRNRFWLDRCWPASIGSAPLMPWRLLVLSSLVGAVAHSQPLGFFVVPVVWGLVTARRLDRRAACSTPS